MIPSATIQIKIRPPPQLQNCPHKWKTPIVKPLKRWTKKHLVKNVLLLEFEGLIYYYMCLIYICRAHQKIYEFLLIYDTHYYFYQISKYYLYCQISAVADTLINQFTIKVFWWNLLCKYSVPLYPAHLLILDKKISVCVRVYYT